jgi:hypothetical protein
MRDVTEEQRATRDEMANAWKYGVCPRIGYPESCFGPPGTVLADSKATVAMRIATTEQDCEVFISHLRPSFTSSR